MPVLHPPHRTESAAQWFQTVEGRAVLDSEQTVVADALASHPVVGLPWLRLSPVRPPEAGPAHGLQLYMDRDGWRGTIRCTGLPPLASESLGAVVLQHVLPDDRNEAAALIEACARCLVPGGRLSLLSLNPLSPYRLRWRRARPGARDPAVWRRLLLDAGLTPDDSVSGIGPQWTPAASPSLQSGAGIRAAYVLRAEKRAIPLSLLRARRPLSSAEGAPAALNSPLVTEYGPESSSS